MKDKNMKYTRTRSLILAGAAAAVTLAAYALVKNIKSSITSISVFHRGAEVYDPSDFEHSGDET